MLNSQLDPTERNEMNIELHGFEEAGTPNMEAAILSKLTVNLDQEDARDCIVTTVSCTTKNTRGRKAPFIRVYSNEITDFAFVAKHLKSVFMPGAGLSTFIECILLNERLEI